LEEKSLFRYEELYKLAIESREREFDQAYYGIKESKNEHEVMKMGKDLSH